MRARVWASTLGLSLVPATAGALPAFPGAEGFGAVATGGRGGEPIIVTTLAESGPGSLREALETPGPRIIVFAVSGVIDLGEANADDPFDESDSNNILTIAYGDVTIAGQTAPGAGITIRGRLYAAYDESVGNIILRHVRIRPGPFPGGDGGEQYDALRFSLNSQVMVDHVSVSFGVDENVDMYEGSDITMQWSAVEEAATEGHPEGDHNYGILNMGGRISVHHVLFAHNRNRNPALAVGPAESINNVAYNVRHGFVNHNDAAGEISIVGNTFVQGPDDTLIPLFFDGGENVSYWLANNCADDPGEYTGCVDDPWGEPYFAETIGASEAVRAAGPFAFSGTDYVAPTEDDAMAAYDAVLECAGAFPRDVVGTRIVQEVIDRSGTWGAHHPDDYLEGLVPGEPPVDADADGMADDWESEHGLDPADGSDHAAVMESGYTAIEEYVNELADAIACGSPSGGDTGDDGGSDDADGTGADDVLDGEDIDDGEVDGFEADGPSDGGSVDTTGGTGSASASAGSGENDDGGGCGCTTDRRVPAWAWLAALAITRRRRARCR